VIQIDDMSMGVSAGGFAFHYPSRNSYYSRMRRHAGDYNRS
jgi:hypothetical protein